MKYIIGACALAILPASALALGMEAHSEKTTAAMQSDAKGLSDLSGGEYTLDSNHAIVLAQYSHMGFSNPVIRFDGVTGTAMVDPDDPTTSTLTIEIDPTKIDSGIDKFDQHLKSGDMFSVDQDYMITFTSTEMTMDTDTTGQVTGDLTIMGNTKPVTLDVTLNKVGENPMSGDETFGVSANTTLMRSEWGLGYATPAVSDEVDLMIQAEFMKAQED